MVIYPIFVRTTDRPGLRMLLLAPFTLHYFNRSLIYPFSVSRGCIVKLSKIKLIYWFCRSAFPPARLWLCVLLHFLQRSPPVSLPPQCDQTGRPPASRQCPRVPHLLLWDVHQHPVRQNSPQSEERGRDRVQDPSRRNVQICQQPQLHGRNHGVDRLRHDCPDCGLALVRPVLLDIPGLESCEDPPVVSGQVQVGLSGRQEGIRTIFTVRETH